MFKFTPLSQNKHDKGVYFMKKMIFLTLFTVFTALMLTGCNDEAEDYNNEILSQPVKYEQSNRESNKNESKSVKPNVTYSKKTTNSNSEDIELAEKITKEVKKVRGVHDAQVMIADGKINVAIDSEDEFRGNPNLLNNVRDKVEPFADGRSIELYSDGAYFDRMRNMSTNP